MKRLAILLFSALIIYVIYFDLSKGTLPIVEEEQAIEATSNPETETATTTDGGIPFFEKEVKPGETVLSIIEQKMDAPIPTSITEVITDFSSLNDGLKPEELKYGKTYRFPDYKKAE